MADTGNGGGYGRCRRRFMAGRTVFVEQLLPFRRLAYRPFARDSVGRLRGSPNSEFTQARVIRRERLQPDLSEFDPCVQPRVQLECLAPPAVPAHVRRRSAPTKPRPDPNRPGTPRRDGCCRAASDDDVAAQKRQVQKMVLVLCIEALPVSSGVSKQGVARCSGPMRGAGRVPL